MDIIEMTRELGRALQNDERYIAMMAARQASDEDEALQEAIGEFNLKRMAISNEAQKEERDDETLRRLNDEFRAVYQKIMENRTVSEEEAKETAKIVGLSALKYGDLSNQAAKDYVFDIDRFTSFEGNTGPYILYTIVRIKSILNRSGGLAETAKILPAATDAERALQLEITKYNEVLNAAFDELAPHKICQYVYDLSNACNRFYHDTKIITEEDEKQKESWLALVRLAKDVLETCIHLLGIQAPDRM